MDLARSCPFPVGVVSWSAPEPRRTVIVKATFALDRDGELLLAHEQRALDVDRPGTSSDELAIAGDFAPHKERVDVILVGHAHTEAPSLAIDAAIEIGSLRRAFVAVSAHPARAIPLTVAHLRSGGAAGAPVRVGPVPPRSPARRAFAGDHPLDREGAPVGALAGEFDFGFFNAAPQPQQIEALPPGAEIVLRGLLPGAPHRAAIVPRRRALVYLVDGPDRRVIAVGVRCDTMVIDTDRAELTLTWRGSFDAAGTSEGAILLVAYELAGTRWSPAEVRQQLDLAVRGRAVTPAPPAPPRARSATLVDAPASLAAATPFARREPAPASFPTPPPRDEYHDELPTRVGNLEAPGAALPFAPRPAGYADEAPTQAGPPKAAAPALPFVPRPAAYGPPAPPSAPQGFSDELPTRVGQTKVPTPSALPFTAPRPPHDEVPTQTGSGAPLAPTLPFASAPPPSTPLPFAPPRRALPFPAPAAKKPYDGRSTVVFEEGTNHDGAPVLPFPVSSSEPAPHAPISDGALPFRAPSPPPPARDEEITAFTVLPRPSASLPFVSAAPAPPPLVAMDEPPTEEPEPPTIPPAPPEPEKPAPLGPIDSHAGFAAPPLPPPPPAVPAMALLEVGAYARIVGALRKGKRGSVLARHGFTPTTWKTQERMQMDAIEQEARRGLTTRADALAAALDDEGVA